MKLGGKTYFGGMKALLCQIGHQIIDALFQGILRLQYG